MNRLRRSLTILSGVLLCAILFSDTQAEDALAFVTEVKGDVSIIRKDGKTDMAAVGSQLFAGDQAKVKKGKAVLIYLSGRTVEIEAGKAHKVEKEKAGGGTRMERLMGTLDEMIGAQEETDRPVVHGMARNLPLTGATPLNTRISHTGFTFSWDALEGAESYTFTLESTDGKELATKSLQDTTLATEELGLEPGQTYVWSVVAEFIIPHSTGKNQVEIAPTEESEALSKALKEVDEGYTGTTRSLLKAATCYKAGFLYEAQNYLMEVKGKEDVASVNKMLQSLQGKMQRKDPTK